MGKLGHPSLENWDTHRSHEAFLNSMLENGPRNCGCPRTWSSNLLWVSLNAPGVLERPCGYPRPLAAGGPLQPFTNGVSVLLIVIALTVVLLAIAAIATYFLGHRMGVILPICVVLAAGGWAGTAAIANHRISQIACAGELPCTVSTAPESPQEDRAAAVQAFVALRNLNDGLGWLIWGVSVGGVFFITPRRRGPKVERS